MVRFVRTLQHRVTSQGADFYALSIPPQVAEHLGLEQGGQVAIEVRPIKRGKSEIVISKLSQTDAPNHLLVVSTPDGYIDLEERPMPLDAIVNRGPSRSLESQAMEQQCSALVVLARLM